MIIVLLFPSHDPGGAKTAGSQPWQPKLIQWIKAKGIRPKSGVNSRTIIICYL